MKKFADMMREAPEGVSPADRNRADKLLRKVSPKTKLDYNASGRKVTVKGPDGEAVLQQGIGDGKWRARYGSTVEEVSNFIGGLEFVLDWVDSDFNVKKFKAAVAVAAAGEDYDE